MSRRLASVPVVRGAISVCFALGALAVMAALLAAFAFVLGVLGAYAALLMASRRPAWSGIALDTLFGVTAGMVAWQAPGVAAAVVLYLFAAWALLRGSLEIAVSLATA